MERVDPARLEASQPAPGLLDKLAPSRRQAALWQQFVREHGVIAGESHDQFKTVFGPAFLKAYEQEVARFNDEARNA
jgi:predicted component of type VI protein secretion system